MLAVALQKQPPSLVAGECLFVVHTESHAGSGLTKTASQPRSR